MSPDMLSKLEREMILSALDSGLMDHPVATEADIEAKMLLLQKRNTLAKMYGLEQHSIHFYDWNRNS